MTEPIVLRTDRDDGLTILTLNRPDKRNALNVAVFMQLREHLVSIEQDPAIGCVVLRGAGPAFSAGADLGRDALNEHEPDPHFKAETVDALEALPCPTIARLNGYCLTGGLELALACDLLIAGASTTFADTHGTWGLVPGWGLSVRLPERVGRSMAKELSFTSRRIGADEAHTIGLIDRVVPDEQLDGTVDQLAAAILANSRDANRMVKAIQRDHAELTRQEALAHERSLPYGRPADMRERLRSSAHG